jgi:hypothetical protein
VLYADSHWPIKVHISSLLGNVYYVRNAGGIISSAMKEFKKQPHGNGKDPSDQ